MEAKPTSTNERIITIDIIRGIALMAILMANMVAFKTPVFQEANFVLDGELLIGGGINQIIDYLLHLFIHGKFYPMFSLLFGLGFFLFYERMKQKELNGNRYFTKRALFLLVMGFLHVTFIWSGDILHTYAIAGLFLMLFINKSPKTILIWAIVFVFVSMVIMFISLLGYGALMQFDSELQVERQQLFDQAMLVFSTGTYAEILQFRILNEVSLMILNLIFTLPNVLGLFLIGLYMGKKGMFHHIERSVPLWKKVRLHSFWSGGILAILFVFLLYNGTPYWLSYTLAYTVNIIGGPLLMLWYVSSMILAFQNKDRIKRFLPIAAFGRMALTNYIVQSIICIFILYGFGFGLFGSVGTGAGVAIAAMIIIFQVIVSHFWLKRFSQGPLEALWRRWTYSN
ncbi:DUF418 domain-containing protein [Alkalihalobacterium elongatum]|uniref:DUF418 domain-containing protein n=1 Tax=Alkalihalobacterium elongatum TaxID=2675466 RepID=UPI001C1F270D|nr:DUF418 domain-containing protein [Alkalihalobacterium elongatum]